MTQKGAAAAPPSAYLGIHGGGVGQAGNHDRPAVVVGKVQALAHFATTDGKENGPLVARVIHFLVKLVHGSEELVLVARLHNGRLDLLNAIPDGRAAVGQLWAFPRLVGMGRTDSDAVSCVVWAGRRGGGEAMEQV